jgi:agmatinase
VAQITVFRDNIQKERGALIMKRKPFEDFSVDTLEEAHVALLGVPFDGGASAGRGAAAAPDRIREASRILSGITEEGHIFTDLKLKDEGDVPLDLDWERYFGEVEARALALLKTGRFCLFLGGDHSVTIPLETAFARAYSGQKLGIIHFDSHTDIACEYDGHRWSHACTQRRALEQPGVKPAGLTFLGIRSYMEEELEYLRAHPEIRILGAREIYLRGIDFALREVQERYRGYDAIYLTIDIDVLDPAYAPGTGTPEAGGLSTRELMELTRGIVAALPVKAVDVVEVAPPLDRADITSWAALKVIYEILGAHAKKEGKLKPFSKS